MKKIALVTAVLLVFVLAGILLISRAPHENEHALQPSERLQPLPAEEAPVHADAGSMQDCLASLTVPEGSRALMLQQRRLRIESFIKSQGNPLERELAADLSGIRRTSDAALENGLPASLFWTYSVPSPPGERRLSAGEQRRLEDLLRVEGIDGLIALGDASIFQALRDDTTLAGYLIREHGDALYAALPALGSQLPIGLHELAIAVEEGAALNDFLALLDATRVDTSAIDPAATWLNGANLAKVAAIHTRPELLRALVSHGVDPKAKPLWGHRSVLDDIASGHKPQSEGAFADVVRQLVEAGDQPYLPSTLSTLQQWLPEVSMPPLHPDAAAALRAPSLTAAVETIAAMDAEWTAKADAAARLEQRCEELIAIADSGADAFHGTSLAAKRRHQEALQNRKERWLEELARAAEDAAHGADEIPAYLEHAKQQLGDLVADGKWDEAIALADDVGENAHLALLYIALGADAPLEALLELIHRNGGVLPKEAFSHLMHSPRQDLPAIADALEPFGLDVHYVDAEGRNAFHILARADLDKESTWRFAEYLAGRLVPAKPSALGLDPLDTVLMDLAEYPRVRRDRIRFARFLIDHGAPVQLSHLQLAELIALADEDVFRHLLSVVPELASS